MSNSAANFEYLPFGSPDAAEAEELRRRSSGRPRPGPSRQFGPRRPTAGPPVPPFRGRRVFGGGYEPVWPITAPAPDAAPSPDTGAPPSEQIRWVQFALNRVLGSQLSTDGIASAAMRDALRDFQRREGLPESGFIGPDTITALQRPSGGARGELELTFEGDKELSVSDQSTEAALADKTKAYFVRYALHLIGKAKKMPGLYRFFHPDGRFYTGISINLRGRLLDHIWCLEHLGVSSKPFRVTFVRKPGYNWAQLRVIEEAINKHYKSLGIKTLNTNTELELHELGLL